MSLCGIILPSFFAQWFWVVLTASQAPRVCGAHDSDQLEVSLRLCGRKNHPILSTAIPPWMHLISEVKSGWTWLVFGWENYPLFSGILVVKYACYVASVVFDSATLWTVAHQVLLPMGFSRQKYWSGWPCPSPGVSICKSKAASGYLGNTQYICVFEVIPEKIRNRDGGKGVF